MAVPALDALFLGHEVFGLGFLSGDAGLIVPIGHRDAKASGITGAFCPEAAGLCEREGVHRLAHFGIASVVIAQLVGEDDRVIGWFGRFRDAVANAVTACGS